MISPSPASTSRRRPAIWGSSILLLVYALWITGPYFHSVIVRDAAITSWLNLANAPIDGEVTALTLHPGDIVGVDSQLASLVNPRADRGPLEIAHGQFVTAQAKLDRLKADAETQRLQLADFAAFFNSDLDRRIANRNASLEFVQQRLKIERANAQRFARLHELGTESLAIIEAAEAKVATLESTRIELDDALSQARLHREIANRGLYLIEDNSEATWAARLNPLPLAREIAVQTTEVATARAAADVAREHYEQQHAVTLTAPAGAIVWQRLASPNSNVVKGSPVVAWIDPTVLLVDVPLSDAEAALLQPGMHASVVFEGERRVREGTVILSRGSAATIGADELAAVAKGRRGGIAQVLVQVEARVEDRTHSSIGHTAYVDFPEVGFFSILRARLRL